MEKVGLHETLDLFGAAHEEHDLLAPVRIGKGFRFTFGYTVDDQEIVKDLRA
jgi:acetoacetate decarboxylase